MAETGDFAWTPPFVLHSVCETQTGGVKPGRGPAGFWLQEAGCRELLHFAGTSLWEVRVRVSFFLKTLPTGSSLASSLTFLCFPLCLTGGPWSRNPHIRTLFPALAGVAQWIECRPANQRVTGSIPIQGTCLGCRLGPH